MLHYNSVDKPVCLEYVLNETGLLVVGRLETLYKVTFMNREENVVYPYA
jgi:hypothetical protein